MSAALIVEAPGLATSVQDLGRFGYQETGIPVSGALDPDALRAANALVGNALDEGGLEIRLLGPTLRVAAASVRVALCGTSSPLEILSPERRQVQPWQSVRLERDALLRVPALRDSATACLAVAGGFDVPVILGSRSTCLRAGFGGFEGRMLAEGDRLPLRCGSAEDRVEMRVARIPDLAPPVRVRVVLGPQADRFTEAGLAALLGGEFFVTPDADRMGLRLAGPRLEHASGHDIVSDGIATGAIQVPGDGQPIVLLADHQTTGGYPKIATVISADLPVLGRMGPGGTLRFEASSVKAAQEARAERERQLAQLIGALMPARRDPATLSSALLLSQNLISGMVDATAP